MCLSPFTLLFKESASLFIYLFLEDNILFILIAGSPLGQFSRVMVCGSISQSAVSQHYFFFLSVVDGPCPSSLSPAPLCFSSHMVQFIWPKFSLCLLRFTPHLCQLNYQELSQYFVLFATLVAGLKGWQCLSVHWSVSKFGPDWIISTTIRYGNGAQIINLTLFRDPLTCLLNHHAIKISVFHSKTLLLDLNINPTFMFPSGWISITYCLWCHHKAIFLIWFMSE